MRTFFLIKSKTQLDLLDKSLVLLFEPEDIFKNKVKSKFPCVIKEENGYLVVKANDGILSFHFENDSGVIEKFAIVDVENTDEPYNDVINLCIENNWLLFDLVNDCYIKLNPH